jgi:pimeloyl-ACP methyl ester carboxylesterase
MRSRAVSIGHFGWIALSLVVLTARAKGAAAAAASEGGGLTLEPTTIAVRGGAEIAAEKGMLKVPLRHADAGGASIEIAFIRVKSVAARPGPPTFVLAGGPGDSGVRIVRQMFGGGNRIRSVLTGDVIGIDQRGAGASRPSLVVKDRYGFPPEAPGDASVYRATMVKTCREVAARMRKEGVDLAAFNTNENADDVDLLRRRLGYETTNLWGTSYGSQLALTVLRRHEGGIARAMLASPVGPDNLWKRPGQVQACLERLGQSDPKLLRRMRDVFASLEKQPVSVPTPHPATGRAVSVGISAFDLRLWTWASLGQVETTKNLPRAFKTMSEGDFTGPAMWLLRFRLGAGVGSAMNHAMDAASGCSAARRTQISKEAGEYLLGDIANEFDGVMKDAAWDVPRLGEEFHQPVRSSRPVLIVCGELDAKTPVECAKEILSTLPNGRAVFLRNEGHDFRPREDVAKVIAAFFRGEELPREQWVGE